MPRFSGSIRIISLCTRLAKRPGMINCNDSTRMFTVACSRFCLVRHGMGNLSSCTNSSNDTSPTTTSPLAPRRPVPRPWVLHPVGYLIILKQPTSSHLYFLKCLHVPLSGAIYIAFLFTKIAPTASVNSSFFIMRCLRFSSWCIILKICQGTIEAQGQEYVL